ncbi:exonuclease [Streptomyces sp. 3213.3]|uniref:exonuclease n=1 Tax=Streptomyces sp. 3213.3 TaxID=1855348 RepID=UPI001F168C29|nr:exonuclease [Streptomyces sp. 3213.3]
MPSLGAAVAGTQDADGFTAAEPEKQTFYRELRPIGAEFSAWVREVAVGAQPVMCGYPASYDWMFLYWYLIRFTGASPFGHSGCLDMKTLYATKARLPLRAVAKATMPRELLSRRRHTHHALVQAELFANLMAWPGNSQ